MLGIHTPESFNKPFLAPKNRDFSGQLRGRVQFGSGRKSNVAGFQKREHKKAPRDMVAAGRLMKLLSHPGKRGIRELRLTIS